MPDLSEAVYRAEDYLFEMGRQFTDDDEVRRYIANLTMTDWWMDTFRNDPCPGVLFDDSNCSHATVEGIMLVGRSGRNLAVILHELAHYATFCADGHGPIYREAMKKLVRREMGFYAWAPLENSYRKHMGYAPVAQVA